MSKTARDIMTTELITVTPATPLSEFARICAEDNISGAPVVEVDGRLVGIVSRTDLLQRILEDEGAYGAEGELQLPSRDLRQVGDIMQPEVVTVPPSALIRDITVQMAENRIHRVVVTEGGKPAGIVTSLDLLAHYASR